MPRSLSLAINAESMFIFDTELYKLHLHLGFVLSKCIKVKCEMVEMGFPPSNLPHRQNVVGSGWETPFSAESWHIFPDTGDDGSVGHRAKLSANFQFCCSRVFEQMLGSLTD